MKQEALTALLVSRAILDQAEDLCASEDAYSASAGLVLLQDALELVLYAGCVEKGVTETTDTSKWNFDQWLKHAKTAGAKFSHTEKLRVLNKTRVTVKHFGQRADPASVHGFLSVARSAIGAVTRDLFDRPTLREVLLSDVLRDGPAKEHLELAGRLFEEEEVVAGLTEVRKAIFLEVEVEYCVDPWSDRSKREPYMPWDYLKPNWRGLKAPFHTKNKEWIDKNVDDPFSFVQLDHDKLRMDLLEWGVRPVDFSNILRLTPPVFQYVDSKEWLVKLNTSFEVALAQGKLDPIYCLDRAVSVLSRKQGQFDLSRIPVVSVRESRRKIQIRAQSALLKRADRDSSVIQVLRVDEVYEIAGRLHGFDGVFYYSVFHPSQTKPFGFLSGYVEATKALLLDLPPPEPVRVAAESLE